MSATVVKLGAAPPEPEPPALAKLPWQESRGERRSADPELLADGIFAAVTAYIDRRLAKEHERLSNHYHPQHPQSAALVAEVASLQAEVVGLKAKIRVLSERLEEAEFTAARALGLNDGRR